MKKLWLISLILVTSLADASTYLEAKQAPAYYRIKIGKLLVTAVSDGTVNVPFDNLLTNISKHSIVSDLNSVFLPPSVETSINAFVVDDGEKQVLIDSGAGRLFGDAGGHIVDNLSAAGYPAESIDTVLLTHIHADHSGGISSNGNLVFPNANVYVDKHDSDFWLNKNNIEFVSKDQRHTFQDTENTVGPVAKAGRLISFQSPTELFSGIEAIPAPGHTPGSVIYKVSSEGESILFIGDIVHIDHIQLPNPNVAIHFDVNQKDAIKTREKILQDVARERDLIASAHISFPGFGHIKKEESGYRWLPLNYSKDLKN
ncbi:MBL fold metallo-hydrolase [Vibrio fluvialis]|nr:MBL fold metallo-hydrolase [Vibrio fluvialis]